MDEFQSNPLLPQPCVAESHSPLSLLEVVLAHRNILEEESDQTPITPLVGEGMGEGRLVQMLEKGENSARVLTVVLILPLSVVRLSRWWRLAKGLAAPQDSR